MADGQGKYGSIVVLDTEGQPKQYPKGMPIFVLLGQDALAPAAVEAYADELHGRALAADENGDEQETAMLRQQSDDVRAFAMNMRAWQMENPALVKRPD